jgi:hypothetical protein
MNYQRIYNQIIEKAKSENRRKYDEIYYESHHILPRCLGGSDILENKVLLTAKEHFLCHWLLVRIYPESSKLAYAFWMICNKVGGNRKKRYTPSSRTYKEAREMYCEAMKGKVAWNKGVPSLKKGINQTREHVEKRSKANRGKIRTEEARYKMSQARKGKTPWNKGISRSKEQNQKWKKPVLHKESGIIYESFNQAAETFKCSGQTISNRVKKGVFELIRNKSYLTK